MSIRYLPDSPPVFDTAKARSRWAAAKADYLAGAGGPEVCERHGLSLSTFRWRAKQEGWRRADQPAPFVAPDPPPEPLPSAPALSEDPGPETPASAPLTAAQMVDRAWSKLQAAMAAGRLIEARGWLRLHKDLQPLAREEAAAARRARMDREASERRDRLSQGEDEGENGDTGAPDAALPNIQAFSARTLKQLQTELKDLARLAGAPSGDDHARLQLDCFSPEESKAVEPWPPD